MKITIAILGATASVLAAAPVAQAKPVVDPGPLPEKCRPDAEAPTSSQTQLPVYSAKTSTADCEATVAVDTAEGPPTAAAVKALDAAIMPSLALLEDAIANGDLENQIVATYAKADLLIGLDVHMAGSVGRVGTMAGSDLIEYRRQIDQAHALAGPWRERGVAAYRDLERLINTTGGRELARRNPVIMFIATQANSSPTL